jgi:hypothetical protein
MLTERFVNTIVAIWSDTIPVTVRFHNFGF